MPVHGIDNGNNKHEVYTTEELLAILQQAIDSGSLQGIDPEKNPIVAAVRESHNNSDVTFWSGTEAEFNELTGVTSELVGARIGSDGKLYILTGDTTLSDTIQACYDAALEATEGMKREVISVTLLANAWSNTAPYTQTVGVPGMTEDKDFLAPYVVPTGNESDDLAAQVALSCISGGTTDTDSVTFYCYDEKPTTTITVYMVDKGTKLESSEYPIATRTTTGVVRVGGGLNVDELGTLSVDESGETLTVKGFGAVGDGVTDDTYAIRDAIAYCKEHNVGELLIPNGEFVISGTLTIDFSNFALKGTQGSLLKFVGDGTGTSSKALNLIEIVGTSGDDYIENISIENIKIDGTHQVYKGGYSMENPTATNTNPGYRGLLCIKADYCKNVSVEGCLFNDIYGEGIIMRYCADVTISNNHLYDVSSGNIDLNGQTGWDNHGDAIATFFSYDVQIAGNTVINRRTYQAGTAAAIGKQCGRSGLEFEYAINQDAPAANPNDPTKNAPGYSDIQTELVNDKNLRYGVGLRMLNNYVYGYTKGIHLESHIKCIVNNNTVVHNHVGLMASIHNFMSFSGNYFNPMGVGAAPQSGYDGYYGGIAVSEYAENERRYGVVISNNTFAGEGKGVTVASNYVTIIGNRFNCDTGIFCQKTNLTGLDISHNTFNNALADNFVQFMMVYNVLSARIIGNSFYGSTFNVIPMSGNNIVLSENEFVNTAINHNNGGNHLTIRDNLFKGSLFTDIILKVAHGNNSFVDNNNFDIEDFNTDGKVVVHFTDSTTNSVFSNNKFSVTTTRSDLQIVRFETIEKVKILNNSFLTDANVDFIRMYVSRSCEFRNNKVANALALVFHHYGGFEGCTIYENNIGALDGSGYKPNDRLSMLVNQYYNLSQKMYKYDINSSSTTIGWICTSAGYYVTQVWATGSIAANKLIKNANGNVYKCITKGSGDSSVEPTHTTFANVTESDGYEWQYLGSVATFSELTI